MTAARIRRNPISSIALVLLIAISSATAGAGAFALTASIGATDRLFDLAKAPDTVQMHVGAVDPDALDAFAAAHPDVIRDHHDGLALQLDNLALRIDGATDAARAGVMDLLLVTQNPRFDLLLGRDGRPVAVGDGEIAVPSYYAEAYDIERGDVIEIAVGGELQSYTVVEIALDAQMGPSLVNSKRFVVSSADWQRLSATLPVEHIIAFLLADGGAEQFAQAYRLAELPANGAAVDGDLLRLIAALSDGLVAIVTILAAIVLLMITLLCLRIMVLTAIEEDTRRIGLLRAIGFSHREVSRTMLLGSAVHAAAGLGVAGLLVSPASSLLTGAASGSAVEVGAGTAAGVMLLTTILVSALPLALASHLLRRVRGISPLAALLHPPVSTGARPPRRLLRWDRPVPSAVRLAARSLTARRGTTALLISMVAYAVVLSCLPLRVTQTIAAPEFVTVMGVGQSDIRAFLRDGGGAEAAARLEASLSRDPEVDRFSSATSYRVEVASATSTESIALEVGDTSLFPVAYVHGTGPTRPGELALSTLAAESAGVEVGQFVDVRSGETTHRHRVTAIYHDITNGGRSGKAASFDADTGIALWQTVLIDVGDDVDPGTKAAELSLQHPAATVTELDRFVQYTLGDTVERLHAASTIAWGSAFAVMLLVFALRGRLESARDESDLRLLRLLGWPAGALRSIALIRAGAVAAIGLLLGWIVTESLGPSVLGAMVASFGGGTTALASTTPLAIAAATSAAAAAVAGTLIATSSLPALRNES